ncbi:hypothetical protein FB451DRAFT_591274 [Mycena latifolia]|nr:hypothetical protein FB451DRAFT_591274 [Mycena latifolia]
MRFFFVFCNDVPASTRSHWLVARTKLFLLSMLRLLYCLPHCLALIGSPPHVRRPVSLSTPLLHNFADHVFAASP